jgi:hypothetical protein
MMPILQLNMLLYLKKHSCVSFLLILNWQIFQSLLIEQEDQESHAKCFSNAFWYKGYKLYIATTPSGVILAHELTTANMYDSDAVSPLLRQLAGFDIEIMVGDTAYDSKKVRSQSDEQGILFLSSINPRKGGQRKDAFGRVAPLVLKTTFGRSLMVYRRKIEHVFCCLKNKLALEQPR